MQLSRTASPGQPILGSLTALVTREKRAKNVIRIKSSVSLIFYELLHLIPIIVMRKIGFLTLAGFTLAVKHLLNAVFFITGYLDYVHARNEININFSSLPLILFLNDEATKSTLKFNLFLFCYEHLY